MIPISINNVHFFAFYYHYQGLSSLNFSLTLANFNFSDLFLTWQLIKFAVENSRQI